MNVPDGFIFLTKIKDLKTVAFEQLPLVTCKNCMYRDTDCCKWREDESPDDDDFCSIGEAE